MKKIEQLKKLMEKVGHVLGLEQREINEDAQMVINIASNLEQVSLLFYLYILMHCNKFSHSKFE